jgi:hypothetical protein
MFFPSATVVSAMVLSFTGASFEFSRAPTSAPAHVKAEPATRLAAGLWAPKKVGKPRPARKSDSDYEQSEEELLRSPSAPTPAKTEKTPASRRRKPIMMEDGEEEEADEGEEEDDDGEARVVKKRKRVVEEEDDDAEDVIPSLPPILPRLINFEVGTSVQKRSFSYDLPTMQGDSSFRIGYQIGLESYPLMTQPNGWFRTLGIGASYAKEYGDAITQGMSGMFTGYPVSQGRWGFDVRYAIPAGERVVLIPALGYGNMSADLKRMSPLAPSSCLTAETAPCFADIKTSYVSADFHIRVAATETLAVSLSGGYLAGLGVASGMDQISAQAPAEMKGFHVEAGARLMIKDWFAVYAAVPFRRYSFTFGAPSAGTTIMYRAAGDTYVGATAGIALFTY